ncbi:hypothetical protein I3843_08G074500 [Carya illinoinensis]|uniref:Protein kinase domain-containing protein n=1 Tax=Carya illinoinensis TaxID=32201 RepID=A0A922ECF4_CARIL|nr:hypothetical protein I3842_08G075800 [Carya illinoinensis]KAG6699630.1 hypothetical protein I3842_08G075800 [Carya illinoinensis]KAG6699631.1 hypothetical protein I3842_08G075800 [Carya illinoinensis]KAG7966939.1 hypothetical protein I3843_08G074500 [Carya illinoinensis]
MVCFSCFSPGGKGVRRIEIENGTRSGSRHSADSAGSGRGKKESGDNGKRIRSTAKSCECWELIRVFNVSVNGKGKATLNDTKGNSTRSSGARSFTFRELAAATRGFREVNLIGEGGFGRVYKGRLETGEVVAIKQLDHDGVQGFKEFLVEVLMLSLLHHSNLVTLIGYCTDGDQRLLVYEYMPMGSLEDHLFDLDPNKEPLSWNTRIKVAVGAARGLEHLHCKADPPVIYRDLKSANILLDNDFNPKLSDFGLAKLGPVGDNTHVSTRVMGTYGYCAPEYAMSGKLTLKSDIYSFGVVLLELITGRRAIDCSKKQGEQNLVSWSRPFLRDRRKFTQLVDPLLQGRFPVRSLHHAIAITAMCLQEQPTFRPLIGDIVVALEYLSSQSNTYEVHNSRVRSSLPRSSSQQDSDIFSCESDYRRSSTSV